MWNEEELGWIEEHRGLIDDRDTKGLEDAFNFSRLPQPSWVRLRITLSLLFDEKFYLMPTQDKQVYSFRVKGWGNEKGLLIRLFNITEKGILPEDEIKKVEAIEKRLKYALKLYEVEESIINEILEKTVLAEEIRG